MSNALLGIFQRVREVIHRIHAPGVAGIVMGRMHHSIKNRVAHVHIPRLHVDISAQNCPTIFKASLTHLFEKLEALFHRTLTMRRWRSSLGHIAALLADFLGRLGIDVSQLFFDQAYGAVVEELKVVARKIKMLAPVVSQPGDVLFDRIDILRILFHRVSIIESQMTAGTNFTILLGQTKIHPDRFGMSNMEVTVGLGWETGNRSSMLPTLDIGRDDLANKIFFIVTHDRIFLGVCELF